MKALAIETLPMMASTSPGALHDPTTFSWNNRTSGISGSNMLGVSWQQQYFPIKYFNTLKKLNKTKPNQTKPSCKFPCKVQALLFECFPLKPAWILFQRQFLYVFLEIWLHDAQYTYVLYRFGKAAYFQNTDIKRLNQAIFFCPRKDPRISLLGKMTKLTYLSQTCCKYNWCTDKWLFVLSFPVFSL